MKQIQLKNIFLFLLLCTPFIILPAHDYDFAKACRNIGLSDGERNLKVIEKKDSNRSYVSVLQDTKTGKKFILKQKKNSSCPLQVGQEMLGTHIANKLGILSQKVIIIPPDEFKSLKKTENNPATLHTFVKDKPIKQIRGVSKLKMRQIKLRSASRTHGLNRKIIKSIAKYPHDLAAIAAIDSGLGIDDRHTMNLCFSPTMQRFWLIDMDYTFHSCLIIPCIKQMQRFIKTKTQLTQKECIALERYKITLERIRADYPQETLIELLDEFLDQAGINEHKRSTIGAHDYRAIIRNIEKTCEHMDELIVLLDKLLSMQKQKNKYKLAPKS